MSQQAKKPQVKDLDPKARAKDVKGGVCCIVFGAANLAYGKAVEGEAKVRRIINPR